MLGAGLGRPRRRNVDRDAAAGVDAIARIADRARRRPRPWPARISALRRVRESSARCAASDAVEPSAGFIGGDRRAFSLRTSMASPSEPMSNPIGGRRTAARSRRSADRRGVRG